MRTFKSLICMMVLGAAWALTPAPAGATDLTPLVAPLAGGSFAEKIEAVGNLAASGEVRAVAILEALADGRLMVLAADNRLLIASPNGASFADAVTGNVVAGVSADSASAVTVNNRLRGIVRGALGGVTLLSPDREQRLRAAGAVLKSRSLDLLPILERAAASETDPRSSRTWTSHWVRRACCHRMPRYACKACRFSLATGMRMCARFWRAW